MLQLNQIDVSVGIGGPYERRVLTNLNLKVSAGEWVMVVGPNGSGKSTLFRLIVGALQPTCGQVLIGDQDVTSWSQQRRAGLVAQVMQDPRVGTMPAMSIEENLSFAMRRGSKRGLARYGSKERREYFASKLSLLELGLENRLTDLAGNLSGGQRQALALIMAILADSQVLLLDEITAALDPEMAERVIDIASRVIRDEGRTTLMITHHLEHAKAFGDRTLRLDRGQLALN